MKIDVLTLFPKMLEGFLSESMIGRAIRSKQVTINVHNVRDWSTDPNNNVDDRPFGGGAGMVLQVEPLLAALNQLRTPSSHVIYLCPDGQSLKTKRVQELAHYEHLILISGHYENIDERIRNFCVHEEISIGDYVLTNGTLPAAVLMDAIVRYIPGVLGAQESLEQDCFHNPLLSYPQYTRPAKFDNWETPEVLFSGNHEAIDQWRFQQQLVRTLRKRPDLIFNT